jgi:hypothetical protein
MSANNWSNRLQENQQQVKTFLPYNVSTAEWIYKKLPTSVKPMITPVDQTKTVMIPKDLLVVGSIINPSDTNLKNNIEQIDTTGFEKLNPVSFNFKDDDQNKKHFGLIAQELECIYPDLVTNSEIGFKAVNYIELIPIMLAQMKNMLTEIDKLKEEIKEIKEKEN